MQKKSSANAGLGEPKFQPSYSHLLTQYVVPQNPFPHLYRNTYGGTQGSTSELLE